MIGTWTDGARQGKLLLQSTGMQRWTPLFPTAAEPSAGPPVDLSGQWKGSQGKDNWAVELLLFQRQNEVTGSWRVTIQATSQEFALDEGGFDPGTRKLSFRLQVPGRPAPVLVTGTLAAEGNSIAGTFVTGQGSGSWQVARESQAKVPGNPLREAEKFQQAIGMLEPVR
jgi:hypothetical protein